MTKNFYEKNKEILITLIDACECEDVRVCDDCPLGDACAYYYVGDDSFFEEEE